MSAFRGRAGSGFTGAELPEAGNKASSWERKRLRDHGAAAVPEPSRCSRGSEGSRAAGTRSVRADPTALCVPKSSAATAGSPRVPQLRAALASIPKPGIFTFQVKPSATFSFRGRGEVFCGVKELSIFFVMAQVL